MIYADSNLFIYAALGGEEGFPAKKFIEENFSSIATSILTIDEIAWKIAKHTTYEDAIAFCEKMLSSKIIFFSTDENTVARALAIMREHRLRPRDAFHAATMRLHGLNSIASEDKDFDKLPGVKRIWFKQRIQRR